MTHSSAITELHLYHIALAYRILSEPPLRRMIRTLTSSRSTSIHHTDYDPANHTLDLHFASGHAYRYHNVPPQLHQQFLKSPSLGKAYNQLFYGRPKQFPSQKLPSAPRL